MTSWMSTSEKDWSVDSADAVSAEVMLAAARAKFSALGPARDALLSTGSATLVEKLPRFGDKKWGVNSKGVGVNLMGQILMKVREEARASGPA